MAIVFPKIEDLTEPSATARPAVLLMAYECVPDRGSEARSGWERVLNAAREFEVHVIVSAESLAGIERFRATSEIPDGIHIHTPREDWSYRRFKRLPRFAQKSVVYHQWQRIAFKLARELHRTHRFALVHQVSAATFREPGFGWRLGIPFVWGPVCGTQRFPLAFLSGLPMAEQATERLRNLGNRIFLRNRHVKRGAKYASVLLASNSQDRSELERRFRRPVELLAETGLRAVCPLSTAKFHEPGPLNILWSGEFTTHKALPLLLEAVANLGHEVDYKLHILGRGPLDAEWKALAAQLGLGPRCVFLGNRRLADAIEQFEWAHLLISTTLSGSSNEVILEALGHGVPVMCFDHEGPGDIVTPACGVKIPVTHPGHAVAAMASSIRSLALDRSRLLELSIGGCLRAHDYLWSTNAERMSAIYRSLAELSPPTSMPARRRDCIL